VNDRDKFIQYLKNLRDSGTEDVSVDVKFLLGILGEDVIVTKKSIPENIEVDGGKFIRN